MKWKDYDGIVYTITLKPMMRLVGRSLDILSSTQTDISEVSNTNAWDGLSVSLALRFCSRDNIAQLREDGKEGIYADNSEAAKEAKAAKGLSIILQAIRNIYEVIMNRKPLRSSDDVTQYFQKCRAVVKQFSDNLVYQEVCMYLAFYLFIFTNSNLE